jgi:hypothetical protein
VQEWAQQLVVYETCSFTRRQDSLYDRLRHLCCRLYEEFRRSRRLDPKLRKGLLESCRRIESVGHFTNIEAGKHSECFTVETIAESCDGPRDVL